MDVQVIIGLSGQWSAVEVLRRQNGKVMERGREFFGHVPRRLSGDEQKEVVTRQIRRQINGEPPAHDRQLRGGWSFELEL